MNAENKNCLIDETACGRIKGNPVCPKCGMDERVVYPGRADLEEAQAAALVRFNKNEKRTDVEEALDYKAARGNLERLSAFIDKWPGSNFVDSAKVEIKEIQGYLDAVEEEGRKWADAVKGDSASSYEAYLKEYPSGMFSEQARANIDSQRKQSLLYFFLVFGIFAPFLAATIGARGIWAALLMSLIASAGAGWVALEKGRRWWVWSPVGFIFTFPGFVVAMLLPSKKSGVFCEGWKLGRILNLVLRSFCLMLSPVFSLLSQSWLGVMWPGLIFGYLWFNGFTIGMGKLVFGELSVAADRVAHAD